MGGGSPKQEEYQPGNTEKVQAAVALADQKYFEQTYDPLLVEMRDKSKSDDAEKTLRGRANADAMSALTQPGPGSFNPALVSSIDNQANLASGAIGNILSANVTAKNVKDQEKLNVLKVARGQAGMAGSALANASRLENSQRLADAKANNELRRANMGIVYNTGLSAFKTYGKGRLDQINRNLYNNNKTTTEANV